MFVWGGAEMRNHGGFSRQTGMIGTLLLAAVSLAGEPADRPLDLVIRGGRVVDGTGNPWIAADIGIRGERIEVVAPPGGLADRPAHRVVDASGLTVAPGFIDMLGQSELSLLVDPRAESKIRQGITTEITGEGSSAAPQNQRTLAEPDPFVHRFNLEVDWRDFEGYFARLERTGIGLNFGSFVGATQVRQAVLGADRRAPSPQELAEMASLVQQAMEQGALGLSSSLVYAPASYAPTEELIALARVAAAQGGIYATHLRGEGRGIFDALEEAFRIAREASLPVEIWHLKVAGRDMWGEMSEVVSKIEAARASGIDITADIYPYVAGATSLAASIPPWAHAGGTGPLLERLRDPQMRQRLRQEIGRPGQGWENFYWMAGGAEGVLISAVQHPELKVYEGKRLAEVARQRGEDPLEALFDLLLADRAQTSAIYFLMSEEDVRTALVEPWVSFGTDYPAVRTEGPLSTWKPHPRAYGTFPRVLGRFVRDLKFLRLEEAIRKMTSLPAQRLRLPDRGLVRPGFYADLVLFDFGRITDTATFEDPQQYSDGIRTVIVNGTLVLEEGEMTGALPGQVLRGAGFAAGARGAETPRSEAQALRVKEFTHVIDLSHPLAAEAPVYPGEQTLEVTVTKEFDRDGYFSRRFSSPEHFGTHLDAPIHFIGGQASVDQLTLDQLLAPAVVLDVTGQVRRDADYQLSSADLLAWEKVHGRIPSGAVILARTGWGRNWSDPSRYLNADPQGVLHFPGFSLAAVEWLLESRETVGLGIDTLSVDYGPSKSFPVHRATHSRGLYHLENLANLETLPPRGAFLIVAPLKLGGGSGAPARVFAVVP